MPSLLAAVILLHSLVLIFLLIEPVIWPKHDHGDSTKPAPPLREWW